MSNPQFLHRKLLPFPYQARLFLVDNDFIALEKFGYNSDVDTAFEDIWSGGGTHVPPTEGRVHAIVSTEAADTMDLLVQGLDEDGYLQEETVTLNGTTPVNTNGLYSFIYRMYIQGGSENAGTITATADVDATVSAIIDAGQGQTLMALYQVPKDYEFLIDSYYASVQKGATGVGAEIRLRTRKTGEGWRTRHVNGIRSDGTTMAHFDFHYPILVPELTIVKIDAVCTTVNTIMAGGFSGLLVRRRVTND